MKRILIFFLVIGITAISSVSMAAMSNSRIRKETRFLTDKMAYELNLSTGQYNDVYEINYDFIYSIRYLMDDVIRGEEWALDKYYRFIGVDYFYRPVYASGGSWSFRIYIRYTNHNHFYFGKPYHYNSYCGGHYRTHYHNSYYRGRYRHDFYSGSHSIRDHRNYNTHRRSDFGSVTIRSNSGRRDEVRRGVSQRESSASRDNNRVTPGNATRTGRETRSTENNRRTNTVRKSENISTPHRVTPERTDSKRSNSRSTSSRSAERGNRER